MSEQHTNWKTFDYATRKLIGICTDTGEPDGDEPTIADFIDRDDAERTVALHNALAGIPTDKLAEFASNVARLREVGVYAENYLKRLQEIKVRTGEPHDSLDPVLDALTAALAAFAEGK